MKSLPGALICLFISCTQTKVPSTHNSREEKEVRSSESLINNHLRLKMMNSVQLNRIDACVDASAPVAPAFLLRLLVAKRLALSYDEILIGFGAPGVKAFVRIILQFLLLDEDILRLHAAEGRVFGRLAQGQGRRRRLGVTAGGRAVGLTAGVTLREMSSKSIVFKLRNRYVILLIKCTNQESLPKTQGLAHFLL
jgi:hypothetical protein